MALDYSSWIDRDARLADKAPDLMCKFVLGSLAIDTSRLTDGFIRELSIKNSSAAENFKRRFYEIDSVFRYLRNAFAHGCFRFVDDERRVFVFNVNDSDNVSAAGLLEVERLDRWYQLSCDYARREI